MLDVWFEYPIRSDRSAFSIEPGVYLPDRKLGIRIEDDILITPRGNQNLTAQIPKRPEDVEAAMR